MAKRKLLSADEILYLIRNGSIENIVEVDFLTGGIYDMEDISAVSFVEDIFNEDIVFFLVDAEEVS